MFKFIHAADIHIDSQLLGLEAYEGAPVEQIRGATREAFENLVTLAIEQQVGFLIIAGDLFDGKWNDVQTGLWTAGQFRRLQREDIPVYMIRGNHDALSKVRPSITWPENVHEFSVRRPETLKIESLGVALHGQGFAHQQCNDDLAATYPDAVDGMFNIGVLHTSLSGSTEHDTYAPTREDVLVGRGYDYWALGHIHQRSEPPIRNKQPFIAYSGNTQGRHINEAGEKGCLLVTVEDEIENIEFFPTDTLRWHRVAVDLQEADAIADLVAIVKDRLVECHQNADGRFCAVRVVVRGACAAHRQLVQRVHREETIAEIRNQANDLDEEVWVEKILFATSPPVDLEKLREGADLVGDLVREIDDIAQDEDDLRALAKEFTALADKAAIELRDAQIDLDDPRRLQDWLKQAEGLLVSQLTEGVE